MLLCFRTNSHQVPICADEAVQAAVLDQEKLSPRWKRMRKRAFSQLIRS